MVYSLSSISGKNHSNQLTGVEVILCNISVVLLRHSVCAFFARSPDGRMFWFRYYLLGGDIAAPSGLYVRLCHAYLVYNRNMFLIKLENAWQSLAYSPLGATVSPLNKNDVKMTSLDRRPCRLAKASDSLKIFCCSNWT